jgi:heme exporter protein D
MDLDTLRWMYRSIVVVAALSSWAVCVTYHVRAGGLWRESQWGRHMMSSDALLATLLTFTIVASFIPRWLAYSIGMALMLGYIYVRLARTRLMLRSQSEGEERDAMAEAAQMLKQSREERGTTA